MKVADRIRKLLALGESPNKAEAELALTKARALMIKHKLREEDIADKKREVRWMPTSYTFTTRRDAWVPFLGGVIGSAFCCAVLQTRQPRKKTSTLTLVGFEDDVSAALEALRYAVDCVKAHIKRFTNDGSLSTDEKIDAITGYGIGFSDGLEEKFTEQDESAETGLILSVPQEVEDYIDSRVTRRFKSKGVTIENENAYRDGLSDGRNFDPMARQIEA